MSGLKRAGYKLHRLLLPFAVLYGIAVWIRNRLFDCRLLPSERYTVPIISIGNLAVGGTGKTPLTDYLIGLTHTRRRVAMLSRGYRRRTSGHVMAHEHSTAAEIGDEPLQIKRKYPGIIVAVDGNRRRGIANLLALPPELRPQLILLDDAFQHRYVTPSLSIVVTDFSRLYIHDCLLPVGRLREPASRIERADVVVVSKAPADLTAAAAAAIKQQMALRPDRPLFFTTIAYGKLRPLFSSEAERPLTDIRPTDRIIVLTGIANPAPLIAELRRYSNRVQAVSFPDHHAFTPSDMQQIDRVVGRDCDEALRIVCTEKDAVRLSGNPFVPDRWKPRLYCLPIAVRFLFEEQSRFDELIIKHISTY